jgi:lipopolysaccharide transport protein LptA
VIALLAIFLAAALPASTSPEVTRIRSDSADYDRNAGAAVFEGHVRIDHAGEYTMNADTLYAVMSATNELVRVVAVGNVTITNNARVGTCSMAAYHRARREIEMFGSGKGARARLVDGGDNPGELEGERIRFWLDAEQVEVDEPRITMGKSEGVGLK